jgi:PhoH-like ATPase
MRVKVASLGMHAEEYRNNMAVDSGWTGQAEITITSEQMNDLYENEVVTLEELKDLPANTGLVISSDRGQCLGRLTRNGQVHLVRGDRDVFGVHGRSSEQKLAIDLLLDSDVGIVSLGGRAGTGKSALALCAALEAVMERRAHKKIMVFRPIYAVGGQDIGLLPGTEGEKMIPWGQSIFDTLGALVLLVATEGGLGRLGPPAWPSGLPDPASRSAARDDGDAMANSRSPVSAAALRQKGCEIGKRTGKPSYKPTATLMERREF